MRIAELSTKHRSPIGIFREAHYQLADSRSVKVRVLNRLSSVLRFSKMDEFVKIFTNAKLSNPGIYACGILEVVCVSDI